MIQRKVWTLNKWIVLLVLGALAGLLLEIRYTHRNVLGEEPLSWTPLLYSGLMVLIGIVALWLWERGGRKFLFWGFAIGLIVGPLGLWLHTMKQPVQGITRELSAWRQPIESGDERHGVKGDNKGDEKHKSGEASGDEHNQDASGPMNKPPVLAPLSFFGLGLLGMLACASRFQNDEITLSPRERAT